MTTPLAAQYFFKANPRQALVRPGKQPTLEDLKGVIMATNTRLNARIKPRAEKVDRWSLYPLYGDCEDYVVSKRDMLIQRGFGSAYLLIALCNNGVENHAVLIVKSKVGDYILDNLTNKLVQKSQSKYTWISIQSAVDPLEFN